MRINQQFVGIMRMKTPDRAFCPGCFFSIRLQSSSRRMSSISLAMALTFFSSSANVSWGNASFKVYMGEVENTTLSDFYADELTLVMDESNLSVSSGEMEVVLDAPYKYQGGNLLIDFTEITTGTYTSLSWYGVSAELGAGYSSYGNSLSVGQRSFLPKMTINFIEGEDVPGPGEDIFNTSIVKCANQTTTYKSGATSYKHIIHDIPCFSLFETSFVQETNHYDGDVPPKSMRGVQGICLSPKRNRQTLFPTRHIGEDTFRICASA